MFRNFSDHLFKQDYHISSHDVTKTASNTGDTINNLLINSTQELYLYYNLPHLYRAQLNINTLKLEHVIISQLEAQHKQNGLQLDGYNANYLQASGTASNFGNFIQRRHRRANNHGHNHGLVGTPKSGRQRVVLARPSAQRRLNPLLLPLRLLAALLRLLLLPLRILLAPLIILLRAILQLLRQLIRFLLFFINPVILINGPLFVLNILAQIARIILMILARILFRIRHRHEHEKRPKQETRIITVIETENEPTHLIEAHPKHKPVKMRSPKKQKESTSSIERRSHYNSSNNNNNHVKQFSANSPKQLDGRPLSRGFRLYDQVQEFHHDNEQLERTHWIGAGGLQNRKLTTLEPTPGDKSFKSTLLLSSAIVANRWNYQSSYCRSAEASRIDF